MMEAKLLDIGEKLFGGFGAKDQLQDDEILAGERKLGRTLPLPLRTFYKMVGKNKIVNKAHNQILAPQKLYIHNNAIVFMHENERVMFWGVRLEDLKSEDPPVQQGNDQEDVWYLDAEHLSSFLISTVCWQAALGLPFSGVGEVDDQLLSDLEKQLTNASAGIVDREVDLIGFFEKGLVVAVSKSANKMMVGTNKEKGLESFEERFDTGLDWL